MVNKGVNVSRYIFSKKDLSILIGNVLDHYDTALYGFLAPVIAPYFFPDYDPVVQIIIAYSLLLSSSITKPLGSWIFGCLVNYRNPANCLSISLIGVAITSCAIGCLPTFSSIGIWAPIVLFIVRVLRDIFAAGETTIAPLYIIEGKKDRDSLWISSVYQSSTVLGIMLASGISTLVIMFDEYPNLWRIPFIMGSSVGIIGLLMRIYSNKEFVEKAKEGSFFNHYTFRTLQLIWRNRKGLIRISCVTALSDLTYTIPFIFLNAFIPYITDISFESMMQLNTWLLLLDIVILPCIGRVIHDYLPRRTMQWAAWVLCLTILPLFMCMKDAHLLTITAIRTWIVLVGLVYLCPLNVWCNGQIEGESKYLMVGLGKHIGSALIRYPATAFSWYLYYKTQYYWAPALYIIGVCLVALYALAKSNKSEKITK